MARSFQAALLLLGLFTSAAHGLTDVLLGHGDSLLGWATAWNTPSAGNGVAVSSSLAPNGLPFFNISYNFTSGATETEWLTLDPFYAAAMLDAPNASAISFFTFNPGAQPIQFIVTVQDSAGVSHGSYPRVLAGWRNWTLPFPGSGGSGWLPVNKTWVLPLTQITLGPSRAPPFETDLGWVGVSDVSVSFDAPAASVALPITFLLSQPLPETGGVLVSGDATAAPAAVGVLLTNRLPVPCEVTALVQQRNSTGPWGMGPWQACATVSGVVAPWASQLLTCPVSAVGAPPGFVLMQAVLSNSTCWGPATNGSEAVRALEGGVAIAPPLPPLVPAPSGRNTYPGVFGGQMTLPDAPTAAALVGMRSIRSSGAVWKQAQPAADCWTDNSTCFNWDHYDAEYFALAAAGLEIMLDALAFAPAWASAKNDSGPTWQHIPGPEHYADYQRFLVLLLNRYGGNATFVEVDNEDDGFGYWAPGAVPLAYAINYTVSLINITRDAIAASVHAPALQLVGLTTSGFDIKQQWPGGPVYMYYENAVLAAPGVMTALASGLTPHPYQEATWVPFAPADGRNASYFFPNETAPSSGPGSGYNSTVGQLTELAAMLRAQAAAQGLPGYAVHMRPSEMGYALAVPSAAADGWAYMHAALTAQLLLHMRSAPLAAFVEKAFVFAAWDGCCPEQNSYYGMWRPAQLRTGSTYLQPYTQPHNLPNAMPLPAAAAFATAAAFADVPSGRAAGVFVVDNTQACASPAACSPPPPSCIAFESAAPGVAPLAVLFTISHALGDVTPATLSVPAAVAAGLSLANGLGTPLALAAQQAVALAPDGLSAVVRLSLSPLPQYLTLTADTTAAAVCQTLAWGPGTGV